MNKYAIVTNAHGERYKQLSMLTTPLSSRYAASIGVDFLAFSEAPEDRHPAWAKITLCERALKMGYEWVCWVDTDAFFVSRENIFDLIDDDYFFICQRDAYIPDPRGEMSRWGSLVPSRDHIKMVKQEKWYKQMPEYARKIFESQPPCRVDFDGQMAVCSDPFVSAEWLAAICCLTQVDSSQLKQLCKNPFFLNSGLFLLKNCDKSFDFFDKVYNKAAHGSLPGQSVRRGGICVTEGGKMEPAMEKILWDRWGWEQIAIQAVAIDEPEYKEGMKLYEYGEIWTVPSDIEKYLNIFAVHILGHLDLDFKIKYLKTAALKTVDFEEIFSQSLS